MWVNPTGCLLASFAVRPPPSRDTKAALATSSLVFVQYLAGLAVTESCREILGAEAGARVRLKWPNDIYTAPVDYDPSKRPPKPRGRKSGPTDASELKKLGGVLVSTNFSGGEVDMIVGALINHSASVRHGAVWSHTLHTLRLFFLRCWVERFERLANDFLGTTRPRNTIDPRAHGRRSGVQVRANVERVCCG